MSIQLSDAVNVKKIINDKDYLSVLFIFAEVFFIVKTGASSEYSIGILGVFVLWRGLFIYRKDKGEKEFINKICERVINDIKQGDYDSAWIPISKQYIKNFTEEQEIIDKCWDKLVADGYIFYHDETKKYMFKR